MAGWIILSCCSPQILARPDHPNVFPSFYCPVLRACVNGCLTSQSLAGRSGPGVVPHCCSPSPSRFCVLFLDAVLLSHSNKAFSFTQLPHWIFSLIRIKPWRWWCVEIPADLALVGHQQPDRVQSHLSLFSSSFCCSV